MILSTFNKNNDQFRLEMFPNKNNIYIFSDCATYKRPLKNNKIIWEELDVSRFPEECMKQFDRAIKLIAFS